MQIWNHWSTPIPNSWFKSSRVWLYMAEIYLLKPTLGPLNKLQHLTKAVDVVITRLRIGHTKATKSCILSWSPRSLAIIVVRHWRLTICSSRVCSVTGKAWWIIQSWIIEYSLWDNPWDLHSGILCEKQDSFIWWPDILYSPSLESSLNWCSFWHNSISPSDLDSMVRLGQFVQRLKAAMRYIYSCRTANMSWGTCVVVKQIKSNQIQSPYLVSRTPDYLSPLWSNTGHWPYDPGVCSVTEKLWRILHSWLIEYSLRDNSWDLYCGIRAGCGIVLIWMTRHSIKFLTWITPEQMQIVLLQLALTWTIWSLINLFREWKQLWETTTSVGRLLFLEGRVSSLNKCNPSIFSNSVLRIMCSIRVAL